jgi:hypothetical protein
LLRAKDAVFQGSWIKAVYLFIMIAGILLTVQLGMVWVAASIVFTTFVHYLMSLHLCRQLIGVTWTQQLSALFPSLAVGAVTALACSAVRIGADALHLQNILHLSAIVILMLGALVVLLALIAVIFMFPKIMGHAGINPLNFLPAKLGQLGPVKRMHDRLQKN